MNRTYSTLTAAALLLATAGFGFAANPKNNDLQEDYKKLHQEQVDMRKDLADIVKDRQKLAWDVVHNPGAVKADKIDLRKDIVDSIQDRHEIQETQQDITRDLRGGEGDEHDSK
jgi:hypothetical protein